jgi:hypothetical protein
MTENLKRCPEQNPIMVQAWCDCLAWALLQPEIMKQFESCTGKKFIIATTLLEKAIDEAAGIPEHNIETMHKFVDWFNKYIWGDPEVKKEHT